jgi:lipoic acid synthetase
MNLAVGRRLPIWFKQEIPQGTVLEIAGRLSGLGVSTVCREAKCPNLGSCFKNRQVTFLILGNSCTRACRFCNLGTALSSKQNSSAQGDSLRLAQEPSLVRAAVKILGLRYVVLTSVSRDDLLDGGAENFLETVKAIRGLNEGIKVEILIPDFQGNLGSLRAVSASGAYVIGHNLETVKRLYPTLRPQANYKRSLSLLGKLKQYNQALFTKSALLLGLGETEAEVLQAMSDLRKYSCDILCLGQYLAPSIEHYPVKDFIRPEQFSAYKDFALAMGFKAVLAAPLARSSYKAEEVYKQCLT